MATTTPNFGWPVPTSTDLVKDGATAIEGLGDAIDASLLDLKGGTSGQVLAKNSGTDMDFIWVAQDDSNAIQNAIVDAKGDLIGATAADTPARLAVGTNGQVLTADSTAATGLKWASASSGALTKITSNLAFSGSSTVSVNNCFTSTYTDYLIILSNLATSTSTTVLEMRYRAGGSDNTTTNYTWGNQPVNYTTGSAGGERNIGGTLLRLIGNVGSGTNKASMVFYVNNPQTTAITTWQGSGNNDDATYRIGGQFTATTSFDGFSLLGAINISGNLTVYGYEK